MIAFISGFIIGSFSSLIILSILIVGSSKDKK